jgi:hypothetical protein
LRPQSVPGCREKNIKSFSIPNMAAKFLHPTTQCFGSALISNADPDTDPGFATSRYASFLFYSKFELFHLEIKAKLSKKVQCDQIIE